MRFLFLLVLFALSPCVYAAQQQFGILMLSEALPVPSVKPEGSDLVRHQAGEFGPCAFFRKRGVRWSQQFGDGTSLEVRCERASGGFLPGYHVWFVGAAGERFEIARCVYDSGLNQGWYWATEETDAEGRPMHLARFVWFNVDAGKNDGGPRNLARNVRSSPAEPYLDSMVWVFDPAERKLEYFNDKYEYMERERENGYRLPDDPGPELDSWMGPRVPEIRESYIKVFDNSGGYNGL